LRERISKAYDEYESFCYYSVNPFAAGLPDYDPDDVAEKLVIALLSDKISAKVVYRNKIYAHWEPKQRKKDHMPILNALVTKRVESAARDSKDECLFELPLILAGVPWYNATDAASAIAAKLSRKQFFAKSHNNVLYINWKKSDEREQMKQKRKTISDFNKSRLKSFANPGRR
jgi:hypothetical protein